MDQLVAAAMEEEEEDYEQAVVGRQPTWQPCALLHGRSAVPRPRAPAGGHRRAAKDCAPTTMNAANPPSWN